MDKEGNLLMEMDDILKRWTEYIKEIYNDEQEVINLELDVQGPEIMKEEIRAAMNDEERKTNWKGWDSGGNAGISGRKGTRNYKRYSKQDI